MDLLVIIIQVCIPNSYGSEASVPRDSKFVKMRMEIIWRYGAQLFLPFKFSSTMDRLK